MMELAILELSKLHPFLLCLPSNKTGKKEPKLVLCSYAYFLNRREVENTENLVQRIHNIIGRLLSKITKYIALASHHTCQQYSRHGQFVDLNL